MENYRKWFVLLLLTVGICSFLFIFQYLQKIEKTAYLSEARVEANSLAMSLDLIMEIHSIKIQNFEDHIDFRNMRSTVNQQVIQSAFEHSVFSNFSFLNYKGIDKITSDIMVERVHRLHSTTKDFIQLPPNETKINSPVAKSIIQQMVNRGEKQSQFLVDHNGIAVYVIVSKSTDKENIFYSFSGPAKNLIKDNFPVKANIEAIVYQKIDDSYWHLLKKDNENIFTKISPKTLESLKQSKYLFNYESRFGSEKDFKIQMLAPITPLQKNLFSLIILISGLVITALLAYLLHHLISRNIQIHKIVADRTADLERESQKSKEAAVAKSRFLANISHEIRTPLNIVLGMSDLLQETQLSSLQKHYISSINTSGRHLLHLINDILDMTRVDMSEVVFKNENVKFLQTVEDSCLAVNELAQNKKLDFYMVYENQIPDTIEIDSSRVRQILINLLSNSVKYTEKGFIYLSTEYVRNYNDKISNAIVFQIRDSGIGISKKDQDEIFKAFYQVNSSIKRSQGGVGLGLSIVSSIINRMGGTISVESTVGIGSTFTVVIPINNFSETCWTEPLQLKNTKPSIIVTQDVILSEIFQKNINALGGSALICRSIQDFNTLTIETPHDLFIDINSISLDQIDLSPHKEANIVAIGQSRETYSYREKNKQLHHWRNKLLLPSHLYKAITHEYQSSKNEVKENTSTETTDNNLSVLIVDDDISNKILFEAYCANEKWDVSFANNGQDALDNYLKNKKFDVLVTDLQMPVMDGFTLIQNLSKDESITHKPKGTIILSADSTEETILLAKDYDVVEFLTKPIRKVDFLSAIRSAAQKSDQKSS